MIKIFKQVFFYTFLLMSAAVTISSAYRTTSDGPNTLHQSEQIICKQKSHVGDFTSPVGLFIQERASKQLPGPGQHYAFGALKSWADVHASIPEGGKLLLLVRHGQAMSNWLSEYLGPDDWYAVEGECQYKEKNGTVYNIFDAELTQLGINEAKSLNDILGGGGWFHNLTADKPTAAVVSPLSRCLETCQLAGQGLNINHYYVEELARETLGEDTCDARRSASDVDVTKPTELIGPCAYEMGLRRKFPKYEFPIYEEPSPSSALENPCGPGQVREDEEYRPLGLVSDRDSLWTKDREKQADQVDRATLFLHLVFANVREDVVLVVTHSGFVRSLLLSVEREPYRPQNAELVPVIVVPKVEKAQRSKNQS